MDRTVAMSMATEMESVTEVDRLQWRCAWIGG